MFKRFLSAEQKISKISAPIPNMCNFIISTNIMDRRLVHALIIFVEIIKLHMFGIGADIFESFCSADKKRLNMIFFCNLFKSHECAHILERIGTQFLFAYPF